MLGVKPVTLHIVIFAEIFRISDHFRPAGTEMTFGSVLGNSHLYHLFCPAVGADKFILHKTSIYELSSTTSACLTRFLSEQSTSNDPNLSEFQISPPVEHFDVGGGINATGTMSTQSEDPSTPSLDAISSALADPEVEVLLGCPRPPLLSLSLSLSRWRYLNLRSPG